MQPNDLSGLARRRSRCTGNREPRHDGTETSDRQDMPRVPQEDADPQRWLRVSPVRRSLRRLRLTPQRLKGDPYGKL